jgi:hypothetical protein
MRRRRPRIREDLLNGLASLSGVTLPPILFEDGSDVLADPAPSESSPPAHWVEPEPIGRRPGGQ